MSEELALQLHRLYRDYYARRLNFDDYRYRRAILLDSLAGPAEDGTEADVTLPRAAEYAPDNKIEASTPTSAATKERKPFRWYYVLGACVLIIIAVVFAMTRRLDDAVLVPAVDTPEVAFDALPLEAIEPETEAAEVVRSPDVGQILIEDFVARQDWRPMSLLEFQDSWTRLPEASRIVAKGAVWFEPMSKGIAYQIDETREFSPDPENDEQLDRLYELALHLGLVELVPPGWMPDRKETNRDAEDIAAAPEAGVLPVSESTTPAVDDSAEEEIAAETESNENACNAAQLETRRRNCFDILLDGQHGPAMRVLPAGEFVIGSDSNEFEQPLRSAVVPKPFAISTFEIRVDEFRLYCTATGSKCPAEPWSDDDMPVVDVTWHQAVAYSEWLSAQTGQKYRLPTEEEWEYAARAGTTTAYPFGDKLLPAQARFSSITTYDSPLPMSDKTTQRNAFGLWHAIGNVREWVDADWVSAAEAPGDASMKVVRGGSYASSSDELRSSAKQGMPADDKDNRTGFRLLREL